MRIIGLTGGIASGKSTTAKVMSKLGAEVIDADVIARQIVEPGEPAWREIIKVFGSEVLQEDRSLDREKIARIIFSSPLMRSKLNYITHSKIKEVMKKKIEQLKNEGYNGIIVLDIPLLFESKMEDLVDDIWLVYVSSEVQIERLMKRDQLSLEEAQMRISAQMSWEEKKKKADLIIENMDSWQKTEEFIKSQWEELRKNEENNEKN